LKESRLQQPVEQDEGTWVVYQFADGTSIRYSADCGTYILDQPQFGAKVLANIDDLVEQLESR